MASAHKFMPILAPNRSGGARLPEVVQAGACIEARKGERPMRKLTDLELSRRRLLMGTVASVALGSATSRSPAQPVEARTSGDAEVPSMAKVAFSVNGQHRELE